VGGGIRYVVLRFYPFCLGLSSARLHSGRRAVSSGPVVIAGAALVAARLYSSWLCRSYEETPRALAHERTMTFSKDGVTVRTTINESHSGWSPYRRLYESMIYLLRTTGRSTVMIVPARALPRPRTKPSSSHSPSATSERRRELTVASAARDATLSTRAAIAAPRLRHTL